MERNNKNKRARYNKILLSNILDYFIYNDKSIHPRDSFKETLARYRVYKLFDKFDCSIRKEWDRFCEELVLTKRHILYLYKLACNFEEIPLSKVYDYSSMSEENIIDNVVYISDRWNASHRLAFLLHIINLKEK